MHQCMKNLAWIGDSCLILCGHEYTVRARVLGHPAKS
jgi:hypothetical protein